ncbi:hypothetical protein DdX_02509 [Ditylenchus destructor]|uniref:Uncharacterized protein n=1 Tax=Ditylenchus destructor TaxID=166010 RepID=A0AAD4NHR4_9BILA|nr:hypothetical protein DdX_02509 [Ditylenchus destructor]
MAFIDVNRLPTFSFCFALSAFLFHQALSAPAVPNAPAAAAPSNPSTENAEQQKRFDFNFESKRFDFDSFYANPPMSVNGFYGSPRAWGQASAQPYQKRFDFDNFHPSNALQKRFDFDGFYPPNPVKRFDGYYFAGRHPNTYGFL